MLHYDDFGWRLAELERERLVATMRATASATPASRPARRWSFPRWAGVDLTLYLRSEWARPFARVERFPRAGSDGGLTSVVR